MKEIVGANLDVSCVCFVSFCNSVFVGTDDDATMDLFRLMMEYDSKAYSNVALICFSRSTSDVQYGEGIEVVDKHEAAYLG